MGGTRTGPERRRGAGAGGAGHRPAVGGRDRHRHRHGHRRGLRGVGSRASRRRASRSGRVPDYRPTLCRSSREPRAPLRRIPRLTGRRAVAGPAAWHHVGDERDLQQTVDPASAARAIAVRSLRAPRLWTRASDARREPHRKCAHARARVPEGRPAPPSLPFPRRTRGRGARSRLRPPALRRERLRVLQGGQVSRRNGRR